MRKSKIIFYEIPYHIIGMMSRYGYNLGLKDRPKSKFESNLWLVCSMKATDETLNERV